MWFSLLAAALVLSVLSPPIHAMETTAAEVRASVEENLVPFEHYVGTPRQNETSNMATRMERWEVTGASLAVIDNYNLHWVQGYGKTKPDGADVEGNTVFQLGTLSSLVTAMVTLDLWEEKIIKLDQDVNELLTSWKLPMSNFSGKVTMRHILSNTAGFRFRQPASYDRHAACPTVTEILNGSANVPPAGLHYEPGTFQVYSPTGFTVLEQVLSDIMEKPAREFLTEKLKEVFEMDGSYLDRSSSDGTVSGTTCSDDGVQEIPGSWRVLPEKAAAGVWSSAEDMARALLCLVQDGDSPLKQTTLDEMMKVPVDASEWPRQFGLGPSVFRQNNLTMLHYSDVGYSGHVVITTDGRGWVLLLNAGANKMEFHGEVVRSILNTYGWDDLKNIVKIYTPYLNRLSVRPPLKSPQPYEGKYLTPPELTDVIGEGIEVLADRYRPISGQHCFSRMYPCGTTENKFCGELNPHGNPPAHITFSIAADRYQMTLDGTPPVVFTRQVEPTTTRSQSTGATSQPNGALSVHSLTSYTAVVTLFPFYIYYSIF